MERQLNYINAKEAQVQGVPGFKHVHIWGPSLTQIPKRKAKTISVNVTIGIPVSERCSVFDQLCVS